MCRSRAATPRHVSRTSFWLPVSLTVSIPTAQRRRFNTPTSALLLALAYLGGGVISIVSGMVASGPSGLSAVVWVPPGIALVSLILGGVRLWPGNLEISYKEKSRLKRDARWEAEVERRLALPANAHKRVMVSFERNPDFVQFRIRDEGKGFPWKKYLDFDPSRAFDPNGRGIAMARALSFTQLEYSGAGNEVIATIAIPPSSARSRTGAVALRT